MAKRIRANRRARVNSGAGLTDEQIKARNEAAHKAFLAARRAAQAGSDQSNTKIRTREGKDGRVVTGMQDKKTGDKNTKEVRAARAQASRSGVRTGGDKPFRAGRISHTGGGMGNVDPYGTQARGAGNTFGAQGSKKKDKKKSLDVLQGMLQGMMINILKKDEIDTSIGGFRSLKNPKKRDQDKAQKKRSLKRQSNQGSGKKVTAGMNYVSSIKSKSTCRLWKAELNDTFNTLLDNFQDLYKNTPRDGSKDDNTDRDFQSHSTEARLAGTNQNTKMRQRKREGKPEAKEVGTGGASFNLQSRVGDPALRKALELIEELAKGTYEDDKFNEAEGKSKRKKITNTGRTGRGALGGDDQVTPKAIGESRSDQQVMQS